MLLLREVTDESDAADGPLVYDWPLWITVRGHRVAYGGQELGVAPIPRNNYRDRHMYEKSSVVDSAGPPGLVLATPGGRHVYWAPDDLGTSVEEPPLQPPPAFGV